MSPATDPPAWQTDVLARSRRLVSILGAHLGGATDSHSALAVTGHGTDQVRAVLAGISGMRRDLLRRPPDPLRVVRRSNDALDRLRRMSSVDDILRAAPAEVCTACEFDRALVSRVSESTWLPVELHVADVEDPVNMALRRYVRDARIQLGAGMLEAEVARRRAPALVTDTSAEPRIFPPLLEVAASRAFVVAPVTASGTVVGLLHADAYTARRPLGAEDRDHLHAFADGLGVILERTALLDRLTRQREQIGRALAVADTMVEDMCAAPVQLVRARAPERLESTGPDRVGAEQTDPLTPREREVIALLVSGATNAQIADQISVSETTVKSHVKHILRKLRVSNRAEAISHYLGRHRRQW